MEEQEKNAPDLTPETEAALTPEQKENLAARRAELEAQERETQAWLDGLPTFRMFWEERRAEAARAAKQMERVKEIFEDYEAKDQRAKERDDLAHLSKQQRRDLEKAVTYLSHYRVREIQATVLDAMDLLHQDKLHHAIRRVVKREKAREKEETPKQ